MFLTYLRRELLGRKKHTLIIAIGMALAIALVVIVGGYAAGIKNAQATVLESVYGVGTDVSVAATPTAPGEGGAGGERFDFGAEAGEDAADGTTAVSTSRLSTARGSGTLDASALETVRGLDGVASAAAALSLQNVTFDGQMPTRDSAPSADQGATPGTGQGGAGGPGSSFSVDSTSVLGVDPEGTTVGPLAAVSLTAGRALTAADADDHSAIVDSAYATTNDLTLASTVDLGGTEFTIVGIVSATDSEAATAANLYIPLAVAQSLSGDTAKITTLYVQAENSGSIAAVKTAIEKALPAATVSTQADLAASVSGSLASASSLVSTLGTWISIILLIAAAALAVLFTISGVTRRTRELGTLKAIGWSDSRIVRQVAGESVVQAVIGGIIGVAVGLIGIAVVNALGVSLSGSASTGAGAPGGGAGGPGGGFGRAMEATPGTDVLLTLPINPGLILAAVGLSVLAGLIAGSLGGARAARLRPSEALRALA